MKKLVSMLLVLAMVIALAGVAVADSAIRKGMVVEFKRDSAAYTAPRASKKTVNVVQKGSRAECDKVCGDYARLIVNPKGGIKRRFKTCDLQETYKWTKVAWARGGKDMSDVAYQSYEPRFKGLFVKVTAHTNLRKTPSTQGKSQGVVEKCAMLKLTCHRGIDDAEVSWLGVCCKGRRLFVPAMKKGSINTIGMTFKTTRPRNHRRHVPAKIIRSALGRISKWASHITVIP